MVSICRCSLLILYSFNIFADVETTVSLHNVQEFYLNSISFSFEMDNATYILIENQIYTLQLIDNQFIIKPHSILPKAESEILLIKVCNYFTVCQHVFYFRDIVYVLHLL